MSPSSSSAPAFTPTVFLDPAFRSVAPYAARLLGLTAWPAVEALDVLYRDRLALSPAVALEAQRPGTGRGQPRGRGAVYEVRIHSLRRIPTRPASWHDLMNLLIWCAFPLAKRALTQRQHAIVEGRVSAEATSLPRARTREQDALAMLDEGGVLLLHPPGLADEALAQLLAVPARLEAALEEGRLGLRLFGHALLEAIAAGELARRDLRGAVVALAVEAPHSLEAAAADAGLAAYIADPRHFTAPDPARSLWLRAALAACA